jgi:ABC-type branched-subunit amino acid transport system permease subunit
LVLATVLGGARHFLGSVIGAFAFIGLDEVASQWTGGRYMLFGYSSSSVLAFLKGIAGAWVTLLAAAQKSHGRTL